jgi:hypothetical protein
MMISLGTSTAFLVERRTFAGLPGIPIESLANATVKRRVLSLLAFDIFLITNNCLLLRVALRKRRCGWGRSAMRFTFVQWCEGWIGRFIVVIYPLGLRKRRRKMIKMAQNEELGSSNLTDEVFILASELLWPK